MNLIYTLGLCASLTAVATVLAASDVIEQSFSVRPGGKLVMNVDRGSIEVTSSASEEVEVRVERAVRGLSSSKAQEVLDLHQVQFDHSGDKVTVRAEAPQKSNWFGQNPLNKLRVSYTVKVPEKFDLDLRTAGGNLEIGRVQGEVKARTSGGNVQVTGTRGNAEVRTSGGNLRIEEIDGDLVARTSGGKIDVRSVSGSSDVQTSGGNIRLVGVKGVVKASTSGGHVRAQLEKQPASDCLLRTSGGSIDLELPGDLAVALDARTSGGRIQSDFEGDLNKPRTRLHAEVNGGGPQIVLSTSGGNIDIKRR